MAYKLPRQYLIVLLLGVPAVAVVVFVVWQTLSIVRQASAGQLAAGEQTVILLTIALLGLGGLLGIGLAVGYVLTRRAQRFALSNDRLQRRLVECRQVEEALRRRVEGMTAVAEIGRAVTSALESQVVLNLIVEHASHLLGTGRAALAVVEAPDDPAGLRFVALCGLSRQFSQRVRPLHWQDGTTPTALHQRRPVWSADVLNDPAFDLSPAIRAAVEAEGYRAVLSVPLLSSERACGVLVVYRDQPGPFVADEIELLEIFAAQAAIAIENARLFAERARHQALLAGILEINKRLATNADVPSLLSAITAEAARLVEGDGASVRILRGDRLVAAESTSGGSAISGAPDIALNQGTAGRCVRENRILSVPDIQAHPEVMPDYKTQAAALGLHSFVNIPIRGMSGVIGVLAVTSKRPRVFSEEETAALMTCAEQVAIALERTQLLEEIRQQSASLVQINSTLQHEIGERKRLEAQLLRTQKMEAIGTMAGGIAHDFNNLLAIMLGYTELALLDMSQESGLADNLREVMQAGTRAKDLVQQILAFSRQHATDRHPVQLASLLKETVKLLRASLPSTISLDLHLDVDTAPVLADPTQIHQVLINLCANAEHAMRDVGGTLAIGIDEAEISEDFVLEHPTLHPGPHIRLQVQDTGHGMAPEILERIFDPFFTTKKVGEGSGMGLAAVHGIVTSHHGAITVTSTAGQGTTFDIYLPRVGVAAPGSTSAPAALQGGSECILFVDDEPALATLGQEMLRHLGYDVVMRTSSVEALEAFRAAPQRFDLVITDQTMPQMTGEVLTRELRGIRPDVPVILCTGFSHTMTAEKAQLLHIQEFLLKPLVIHELTHAIRRALDKR